MIYINGRFLTQNITGVQRFASELTFRLLKNNTNYKILVPNGIRADLAYPQEQIVVAGPSNPYIWEQYFLPRYLKKQNNPLLLNFTGIGPICYKNKIITIHDLSFWDHPEWFSGKYYWFYRIFTPISASNSRKILTVSESSKHSIAERLKKQKHKIEVVYNAVNPYKPLGLQKSKVILAVGSIEPRKNLVRLINAFEQWNNPDFELLIIGGKQSLFNQQNYQELARVKFLGYVPDRELFEYYEKAVFFIYPSLYEGFGIPPLEAMSAGTPVMASDIPALHESCGNAAYYIDPYSEKSITNAMDLLANDQLLRNKLTQLGLDNIQRFSWEASSQKITQIVDYLEK